MEDKKKESISSSLAHDVTARSYSPARDAEPSSLAPKSPAESSVSSDLSHGTSLSHGSSPGEEKRPASPPGNAPEPVVNRYVREEPLSVTKVDQGAGYGFYGGAVEGGGGSGRRVTQSLSILRRVKRETTVKKVALGLRVCGAIFCLISFSVFGADQNKGWALDSFYRYKEFRYCMAVTVIGFVYSLGQVFDLAHHLYTGKYVFRHPLRYYFDFAMDQILTYLLMSASSSAATRVEDWESNWGKDKFPDMASASVGMSFMAFVALASSSLISGYALYTSRST